MHSMAGPTSQPRPVPWLIIPSLLLLWSCAAPVQGLWPPPEGAPTRTIVVSLDTWHAMIAITLDERVTALDQKSMFEEWGYAEQAWYLEGRQGITGALRALFRPNPGVVEIGLHEQVWAARTPQPPAETFVFRLSEAGYLRLRRHLLSTIGATTPVLVVDRVRFYPSKRPYHLFHQCHQYAAEALRAAGLPLSAWWAFSRTSFAMQLRRAARMADQAAASRAPAGK
ncbi:MAG: DUF2459 domain-containing protein [Nitrospirae bacterium]|nr:MAG: DUF2459 domain-containing protein [Nitrospirota bacterium]